LSLAEAGIEATVLRLLCVNPIAAEELIPLLSPGKLVYIAEEISGNCGIRESLSGMMKDMKTGKHVTGIDLGNRYIQHGSVAELYEYYGLSPQKMAQSIMEVQNSEE
jgi:deoxyxylulose-5-phosphate synthase